MEIRSGRSGTGLEMLIYYPITADRYISPSIILRAMSGGPMENITLWVMGCNCSAHLSPVDQVVMC